MHLALRFVQVARAEVQSTISQIHPMVWAEQTLLNISRNYELFITDLVLVIGRRNSPTCAQPCSSLAISDKGTSTIA
jgi:hypothetical protein